MGTAPARVATAERAENRRRSHPREQSHVDRVRSRDIAPSDAPGDRPLGIRAAVVSGLAIGSSAASWHPRWLWVPALLWLVGEVPARAVGTDLTVGMRRLSRPRRAPPRVSRRNGTCSPALPRPQYPDALLGARLTGVCPRPSCSRSIGVALLVAGTTPAAQAVVRPSARTMATVGALGARSPLRPFHTAFTRRSHSRRGGWQVRRQWPGGPGDPTANQGGSRRAHLAGRPRRRTT